MPHGVSLAGNSIHNVVEFRPSDTKSCVSPRPRLTAHQQRHPARQTKFKETNEQYSSPESSSQRQHLAEQRIHTTATFTQLIGGRESNRQSH